MATPQLTSTTAPGKVFSSRQELADHYKSDWHKYNLKRREAGLPLLLESDFQARLAAALSLRQEDVRDGTDHLKKGKKQKQKKSKKNEDNGTNPKAAPSVVVKSQAAAYEKMKEETEEEEQPVVEEDNKNPTVEMEEEEKEEEAAEEAVVIDPKQCLFDRHFSASVEANAERMYRKYGLFIPDREYLTDLEGLIGYCHEKIKLGHMVSFFVLIFMKKKVAESSLFFSFSIIL
jgi:pre-60S factor REI1